MQKITLSIFFLLSLLLKINSQPWNNGKLKASENGHFIVHENDTPFFYLACTAWQMLNKLSKEDIDFYFKKRAEQGFNVIMFSASNGFAMDVNQANYYGHKPYIDDITLNINQSDGTNNDWWDHLVWTIKKAEEYGLYVGLTIAFNNNFKKFDTKAKCENISFFLYNLLKNQPNIIWVGGGDVLDYENYIDYQVRPMEIIDSLCNDCLITYHPVGPGKSSDGYHHKKWLDINANQTGHAKRNDLNVLTYAYSDWNLNPSKPVIDIEIAYENHPVRQDTGRFDDFDIRQKAYWSAFSGSCGLGYGHFEIWRFNLDVNKEESNWKDALNAKGASQLIYLKNLLLSKPYTERVPDLTMVANCGTGIDHVVATRGNKYAFIYIPTGKSISVIMGKIDGENVSAIWFNPRTGLKISIGKFKNKGLINFTPPGKPKRGNDWVLILVT